MPGLNRVFILGNAGRDAELRYTSGGTAMSEVSIAVNYRKPNNKDDGGWEEAVEWFNVVMWGNLAERVSPYITKGKPVFIEGRLQTRSWEDDQGVKHYKTEVVAQNVQLLGSQDQAAREAEPESDIDEDELPF